MKTSRKRLRDVNSNSSHEIWSIMMYVSSNSGLQFDWWRCTVRASVLKRKRAINFEDTIPDRHTRGETVVPFEISYAVQPLLSREMPNRHYFWVLANIIGVGSAWSKKRSPFDCFCFFSSAELFDSNVSAQFYKRLYCFRITAIYEHHVSCGHNGNAGSRNV